MKPSIFALVAFTLASCGKSEVDKCLEAFMKPWDAECSAYQRDTKDARTSS